MRVAVGASLMSNQSCSRVQYETTAAAAQAEAPTSGIAREVEQNAEQEKDVAHQAALAAHASLLSSNSIDY